MSEWDYIQAALDRVDPETPLDEIRRDVETGVARLIRGERSAGVLYIRQPRLMHIRAAGGDMQEIKQFEATVEAMAREHGCGAMTLIGRAGWSRALRGLGWDAMAYKEVRHG